jgi:hypothetical protein
MSSYTFTNSQTFTETHAKYLAAKVATDLKRMQRFYSSPSDSAIENYEAEIIQYLKKGYLKEVSYGFKKDGKWIEPTLKYTAKDLAASGVDDDPGKVRPGADISGASFYSFLVYSQAYDNADPNDKESFESSLPISRGTADEPGINGYFRNDRAYYSGGKGLDRSSLKSY